MSTNSTLFMMGGMLALGLLSPLPALSQHYNLEVIGGFQPNGINDKGVVVGQCCVPIQGVIESQGSVTVVTDPLDPTGNTLLYGINDDGEIVGSSDLRSFWLKDGVFRTIMTATSSVRLQPAAINNRGALAGSLSENGFFFGFILAANQIKPLASPATSINDTGDIVGSVVNSEVGYQILHRVYSVLSVAGSTYTYPAGINDQGAISGWYDDQNNTAHGFVLNNGKVTTIDYPEADLTRL